MKKTLPKGYVQFQCPYFDSLCGNTTTGRPLVTVKTIRNFLIELISWPDEVGAYVPQTCTLRNISDCPHAFRWIAEYFDTIY